MKIDLLSRAQLSILNKNNYRYPLQTAEKDYFLAVVLQIICNSNLKNKLVFKGGTAIHHLYLDQLRFSEDLDFNALEPVSVDDFKRVFEPHDFLEIREFHQSKFSLKIQKLKFTGPLQQSSFLKINIELTQEVILPVNELTYKNIFNVEVEPKSMSLIEVCAEKIRAMNERAKYRDFYDLAMVLRVNNFEPKEIFKILKQKELRKLLNKESILTNLEISLEAKESGAENLHYQEEINREDLRASINGLLESF